MLGNGPEAMFAFCPDAGQALGDGFASVPGRVFLGYAGNIGVALLNEECCEYWKTIFDGAALPIAESGTISDEDKKRLMKLYDRAFSHFWTGDGKKNKYRGLMLNYLLQHQQNLCLKPQPHA
jgi:hypothetical protein